ncbi:putative methyltransferase [Candidatus Vecturithrix granuli]|uniref:S-adenosyl-L-methionine-dependent methyltransferase n=1 Tax=Vecturithrix granuli TaxID=1499967 RepID=A0A081C552_VECG1|nr:putative methyltransferase [Candidatus Vecturithrix granuli]
MTNLNASRTAIRTAYIRAAHQLLDAPPRILEDPLAVTLLGPAAVQRINDTVESYQTPERRALRAHVVLRSRFAEDQLATAVQRGVTQYIILGAGFDTFAFRQPVWAQPLQILEVDHAGTQTTKRTQLAAMGITIPENTNFATINFEHESLRDDLLRYHISLDEPTFFSWLGVTMYLKEDAIDAVLKSIATFPAGSEIVLTFAPPPGDSPSPFDQRAAKLGEPWVSYFEPDTLETKLRGAGFSSVEFLSPKEAEDRYFRQRPQDLPIPKRTNIVRAML